MWLSSELQACKGAASSLPNCLRINAFLKSNLLECTLLLFPLVSIMAFVAQMKKRPTLAQSVIITKRDETKHHLKIRFYASVNQILDLRHENTRRSKIVQVLFYWRVTRAFCCCIHPAVKATGVCIVLYNMNNSMHNACANTIFRAFSCEGYVHFPDVNTDFMKDRERKHLFAYKSVASCAIFFPVLPQTLEMSCKRQKMQNQKQSTLQGSLRGCKTNWFFD